MSRPGWLLEIAGLHSGYRSGDILQGVDLTVAQSEVVAVVGRNGVGKTTLMRTIMGLVPTRRGSIHFGGQDISHSLTEDRALSGTRLRAAGQDDLLAPDGRGEPAYGRADQSSQGQQLGPGVRFLPVAEGAPESEGGTLSGGEQQALAIGRALVGQPEALLLDEPSESIQPSVIVELGQVLQRLNRETGMTIVLVEQNLGLIDAVSHRGYVMDKGRTTTLLSREEIKNRDVMLRHLSV